MSTARKNILTLFIFFILLSCRESEKSSSTEINLNDFEEKYLQSSSLQRKYLSFTPSSYKSSQASSLLLCFHGFGDSAKKFSTTADFRSLAEKENFILIYPQGALLDGYSHWNAGLESEENKSSTDDFTFIKDLLRELSKNYNIDTNKIYAAGFSNGAFFSYALSCFLEGKIAAIASVAGTMLEETYLQCPASIKTPMISIHGTNDYVVPYNGSDKGLTAISTVTSFWNIRNENNLEATVDSDTENNIERYSYFNQENKKTVEHFKVIGGGHLWLDINYKGKKITEIIWDFLSAHKLSS